MTDFHPDGPRSPDLTREAGQQLDDLSRFLCYATMAGKGGLEWPSDVYALVADLYALSDPEFRAAYERARHWDTHHPLPLTIDGHGYRRRQLRRGKRGRR